jgi:hypothetical protein
VKELIKDINNEKRLKEIAAELKEVALKALLLTSVGRLNQRGPSFNQSEIAGKGGVKAQLFKINLIGCLVEAGWSIISSNGDFPSLRTMKYGIEAGIESRWPNGSISLDDIRRLIHECKPKPNIVLLLTYWRLSNRAYRTIMDWSRSKNIITSIFYLMH